MTSKYCGYKPYSARESTLTWAPIAPSRKAQDEKFHLKTPQEVGDASQISCSLTTTATEGLRRDDYHVPRRSDEIAMLPMDKPTTKTSSYSATYTDFTQEYKMLEDLNADNFTTAFDTVDTAHEGCVYVSELRMLFRALCKAEPTDRQFKVLSAYAGKYPGGKLSLMDFVQVVSDTADHLKRDVISTRPEATKRSVTIAGRFREQQDAARRMGVTAASLGLVPDAENVEHMEGFHAGGPRLRSSYQIDVGTGEDKPATRPVADPIGAGYFSTTRDLASGTSRQSKHAPGYMGHIPSYIGTHAADQGLGQTKRDTFHSKTNLADTFTRRVPGYGGHVPKYSASSAHQVEMIGGQFAPTESASATHLIQTYWTAKSK